jgi:signal peptidase II
VTADDDRVDGTVSPMTRERRLAYAAIIVALAAAIDQATKQWALSSLQNGRRIDILPSLELDLAFNSGFSFSTASGRGNLVGSLVVLVSLFVAWQIWHEARPLRSGLYAVILGGALGNLIDRIFRADDGILSGEVVDFIDVSWYAVFNMADVFVVSGVIVFVIHEIWLHRHDDTGTGDDIDSTASRSAELTG